MISLDSVNDPKGLTNFFVWVARAAFFLPLLISQTLLIYPTRAQLCPCHPTNIKIDY